MLNVNIPVTVVLDKLQNNLNAHTAAFKTIMEVYTERCIAALTEQLNLAKAGKPFTTYLGELSNKPRNHTEAYTRAIALLKMSASENVVLTEQDFARYIQDDWDWKSEFQGASAIYSK